MRTIKNIKTFRKILVLLLAGIVFFIGIKYCQRHLLISEFLQIVERAGLWAPVVYILLYILISGVIAPSIIIKIFGGTLFGMINGLIIVSIAATLSSLIKFLLARYLLRQRVERRIKQSEKLKTLDRIIEKDGWKMLAILRNVPVFNSMFLNYICGVTKMKVRDFVFASFIGRLPTTIMYLYLGYIVRYTSMAEFEADTARHLLTERIVLFSGLLAVAGASFYLIYISRKVLREKAPVLKENENIL